MFADRIFEEAVAELMGKNKHLQNWSVIARHQHLMFLKKYSLSWYFEFLYCLLMKRVTFFFGFFWDKLIKKNVVYINQENGTRKNCFEACFVTASGGRRTLFGKYMGVCCK